MASRLPYPQDHASHIPFLAGVGARFNIRSVFEFGSGFYSTLLFANKVAYQFVTRLTSVESDEAWAQRVADSLGRDDRIQFILSDEHQLPEGYDLVFIDNGPEQHKIQTIRNMAEMLEGPAIVVVHDAETASYRTEINRFQTKFISEKYNPGVAICTNANLGEAFAANFYSIDRAIEQNYQYPVTDVLSWIEVMNGF
jgi:predicted O-methyltransferase YrrM